ncbi:MAG: hypothetical protein K2Q25_13290, partial [Mycobacteriaceae bacterium]|nr:hypothetical protein [Mycobacteriaceae bacterium]
MELFLAVTALFGGGFNVGVNAASGGWSVPTALDVAAVLGQGTLIAGQAGGLNWLGSCYAMKAPEAGIELVGRTPTGYQPLSNAAENVEEQLVFHEVKKNPIQGYFSSPLIILNTAISIVEWLVVPFFGFEAPNQGDKLELSRQGFGQAYDALELALPDTEQWKGPAAAAYTADTKLLQSLATQAGIDGRAAPLTGSSVDTELQQVIARQARQVELMRLVLGIIVAGLTFCLFFALVMEACAPGASLAFQIAMFILGVGAAGYVC